MSSSNRKPYLTATSIDQSLLNAANDNLSNQIELIVDITAPDGSIIRASDRNKYVGEHFYEALTKFPDVSRTIGEFLGQGLVFSEMTFELSNADGRFNKYLPGGANFGGWIGRSVVVKIGLRDVESSYVAIFRGSITEEGGFSRTVKSITIKARDILEKINTSFPDFVFLQSEYAKAEEDVWNKTIPLIYGDWTVNVHPGLASVPTTVINGADIFVNGEELTVTNVSLSPDGVQPCIFTVPNHRLDVGDFISITADNPSFPPQLHGDRYVSIAYANEFAISTTLGGPSVAITSGDVSGNVTIKKEVNHAPLVNVKLVISTNINQFFDVNNVFLKRSELYYKIPASHIVNIGSGKNNFEITQDLPDFQINGENWKYTTQDEFFVRVKGKSLGSGGIYSDNALSIAQDILKTYAGVVDSDFDSTWAYFRDKSSPAVSAVASIKARAWIGEPQNAMEYAVSLLEQVRLELFFSREQKLSLSALHWDEFDDTPSFVVRNWDIEKDSLVPQIDDRNNFNRMRASYSFLPDRNENAFLTGYYRNQAAINQAGGRIITKVLVYPNLYIEQDVINQAKESFKIISGYREVVICSLTNRAILKDLGQFVLLDVEIGSTVLTGVPCQIRDIGYSPDGLKLPVKLWSFAMLPFQTWNPGYVGIVGGESASITAE